MWLQVPFSLVELMEINLDLENEFEVAFEWDEVVEL
jgi:hypothetical protein